MSLSLRKLKSDLRGLGKSGSENNQANMEMLDRFAKIIYDFVKTAEAEVGIPVSTTGSPNAHTGATTARGKIV